MFSVRKCGILLICLILTVTGGVFSASVHGQAGVVKTSVVDLDGRTVDVFHQNPRKVVVLLFIRTNCPISNRYAPTIQEISAKYKSRAEFYLVYPVKTEAPEDVRKHMNEFGYQLAVVRDPDYELVRRAEVRVTPEAAVFSTDGKLLYHGRINDWYTEFGRTRREPTTRELDTAVAAAVEGKPVATASEPAVGCFLPDRP